MELQVLDEAPSTVLDTSSFVTAPFTLDDLEMDSLEEVPITDTRQSNDDNNKNLQTSVCDPNALNFSVSDCEIDDFGGDYDSRTVCCSRFKVLDKCASSNKKHSVVSSTLASLKLNSVNVLSDGGRQQQRQMNDNLVSNNANGLLSQFGSLDGKFVFQWVVIDLIIEKTFAGSSPGCKTKNNKIPYAYSGGVGGYSNATPTGTLSLHTSAHTLTLSRHR